MDFIGPLPACKLNNVWYDSIYTITDRFTGWVWALPTDVELTAEDAAELFYRHICTFRGLPESIVSDRDTRFTSKFWTTLMKRLNIKMSMSSAFHPQTDGSTERANKTVVQILRNWVSVKQDDWALHLPSVTYAINTAQNETTGMSPFFVTYGRNPKTLPDPNIGTSVPAADEFLNTMLAIQHMASKNIIEAREQQTEQANKRRRPAPTYTIGQQVLLSMENIKHKTSVRSKLQAKWSGPFTITQYWPDTDNVQLELPTDWMIHNIFHTSLVKPYKKNNDEKFPSRKHQRPPPIPEADPQENVYEVEAIRDNKVLRGQNYYLVKWTGWPESDNQWVKEKDMEGSEDLIKEYNGSLVAPPPSRRSRHKSAKTSTPAPAQVQQEPTRRSSRTKKPRVHFNDS
jgi:hypothetical protein